MRVKALRLGYYNHIRIKPGTVFEMKAEDYGFTAKDGKERVCGWVEPVEAGKGKKKRETEEEVVSQSPLDQLDVI